MTGWKSFLVFICGLGVATASACHNGDRIPIDGSCKSFMECENSNLVEKSCGLWHSFDAKTLECRWSYRVDCVDKSKECDDKKLYPHPDSCKLYYECRAGRLSLQFCPILEVFDAGKGKCTWGLTCNRTECVADESRAVPDDCRDYEQCTDGVWKRRSCIPPWSFNPINQKCEVGCKQCASGDRAPGAACNTFQYCEYGRWHDDHCGPLRRFDPVKKSCVWWFQYTCPKTVTLRAEVNCADGSTRPEPDCSKYSVCQDSRWVEQQCPEGYLFDTDSQQCKEAQEARCKYCSEDTPDPDDCRNYYHCELGKKVKKECPVFKKWDGVTKKCVFDWSANCFPGENCTSGKRPTEDCKTYEECISGRYYKKKCGFSRIYDSEKQKCVFVWPWHSCDASYMTPECTNGDKKILSCDQYVECEYGIWNVKRCQDGYTFKNGICDKSECSVVAKDCEKYVVNDVEIECVPGEIFDEEKRVCVVGKCEKAKRALNDCTEGEKQAIPNSCKKYNLCQDGKLVEQSCSDCMNFDPVNKTCKFVFEYACEDPTSPTAKPTQPSTTTTELPTTSRTTMGPSTTTIQPSSTTTIEPNTTTTTSEPSTKTTTIEPSTTTTSPTTTTTTPAPECEDGQRKPEPKDCQKYYECDSGRWKQKSCWPLFKFDSVKLECKLWGAKCA